MRLVKKAWGTETVLVNEPEYCAKELRIFPRRKCSLHYHKRKKETFLVQSGFVRLEQRGVRGGAIDEFLKPGDSRTIEAQTPHRFSSIYGAVILEVSTHHDDADVVRIEPSGEIEHAKTRAPSRPPATSSADMEFVGLNEEIIDKLNREQPPMERVCLDPKRCSIHGLETKGE